MIQGIHFKYMRIISFGYTTAALVAERKDVTRREWKDTYGYSFKQGEKVFASDKDLRYGGKKIAILELTHKPIKESSLLMPDRDYEGEGFAFMDENKIYKHFPNAISQFGSLYNYFKWQQSQDIQEWVIRFKVLEFLKPEMKEDKQLQLIG